MTIPEIIPCDAKKRLGAWIFLVTFVITIISLLLNLALLASSLFYVTGELGASTQWLYIAFPVPIGIIPLTGGALVTYYVILVITIIASALFLFRQDLLEGVKKVHLTLTRMREPDIWDDNYMVLLPRLLSIMVFIPLFSYMLVEMIGAGYTIPSFGEQPLWENFYGFANASVWEELVIRVLLLGIPLAAFCAVRDGWKPRNLLGFGEVDGVAFVLLVFSSLIFAAAHAYGGWDFYKVPPTFFTGMALGYAFLKRGLPGAIILHFALDFLYMPSRLWPQLEPIIALALITLVLAGGYYTLRYVLALLRWVREPKNSSIRAGYESR